MTLSLKHQFLGRQLSVFDEAYEVDAAGQAATTRVAAIPGCGAVTVERELSDLSARTVVNVQECRGVGVNVERPAAYACLC